MQKIFYNLSIWIILAFNIYLIIYYRQHPDAFKTLLFLYWLQSILIGLFTFIKLLGVPAHHIRPEEGANGTVVTEIMGRGCNGTFFLFHYGIFHLVYLIFFVSGVKGDFDMAFIKISLAILLLNEGMQFIQRFRALRAGVRQPAMLMFIPYLRIIPMHLILVGANVWGTDDITGFLILKTLMDVVMHVATEWFYRPVNTMGKL